MSASLLRTALELRAPMATTRLPPAFLLPIRAARGLATAATTSTTTTSTTTTTVTAPLSPPSWSASSSPWLAPLADPNWTPNGPARARHPSRKPPPSHNTNNQPREHTAATTSTKPPNARTAPMQPPPPLYTGPVPAHVKALLPLLRAQADHYITIHVHGRPYLVTPGDSIRLPFLLHGVSPGDVLRLNRASVVGSRDLTLRPASPGPARAPATTTPSSESGEEEVQVDSRVGVGVQPTYVDDRLFECRAIVVGVETEPMREMKKTKRRNRKVKTVKSKHRQTVIRISELKIRSVEEVEELEREGEAS